MVSEQGGSTFPREVVAYQMVKVDVHSSRLRTLQDEEQTNSDGDQTTMKMCSRRVLEASKKAKK